MSGGGPVADDDTLEAGQEAHLWQAYFDAPCAASREAVFEHFLPYAKTLAAQLYAGRHRDDVEFNDFLQLACVGLLEAIDRFDPTKGVAFKTFCTPRLRGNVISGVERLSEGQEQISLSRRLRRDRIASLEAGLGSEDASEDAIQKLGTLAVGLAIGFVLGDTGMVDDGQPRLTAYDHAYHTIAWQQTKARLHGAVRQLPGPSQKVIQYHYLHGLAFDQIADILGVSKGRVSQLHRSALLALRASLGDAHHIHWTS